MTFHTDCSVAVFSRPTYMCVYTCIAVLKNGISLQVPLVWEKIWNLIAIQTTPHCTIGVATKGYKTAPAVPAIHRSLLWPSRNV